jgi:hypothetical protein
MKWKRGVEERREGAEIERQDTDTCGFEDRD